MSLPNYLANIKSAGIYRFVWDKSQMPPQQAETLRLVVGYSEKGPFNTPVYIDSATDFIKIYGNISKKLEKRGIFFHRLALQALQAGPILALNLKKFLYETGVVTDGEIKYDYVDYVPCNPIGGGYVDGTVETETLYNMKNKTKIENVFDITRFWSLDPDALHKKVLTAAEENSKNRYMVVSSTDSKETSCTLILRGYAPKGYDITIKSWYSNAGIEMPDYLEDYQDMWVSDFFIEAFVFRGKFTAAIAATEELKRYFTVDNETGDVLLQPYLIDAFGNKVDTLNTLAADANSNFVQKYQGVTLPFFKDLNGAYLSLDLIFNGDNDLHKMLMNFDESMLYDGDITPLDLTTRGWDRIGQEEDMKPLRIGSGIYTKEDIPVETVAITSHTIDYPNSDKFNGSEVVDSGIGVLADKKCYKLTATTSVVGAYLDEEDSDDDTLVVWNGTEVYVDYDAVTDSTVLTVVFDSDEAKLDSPSKLAFSYTHENAESIHDTVFYNYKVPVDLIGDPVDGNIVLERAAFADLGWQEGDRFLAKDGEVGVKVVTLSKIEVNYDDDANPVSVTLGFVGVNASELEFGDDEDYKYLVKCNHILGDTIAKVPVNYLYYEGYTMSPSMVKPASSKQGDKLEWQKKILSVLTDDGMFEALTNNTDVEYRLLVDTFESFVDTELKNTLSYLTRKKDNALAILNFPAVSTFVNCEYTSFTDADGFKMKYVVEGGNKRKPIGRLFTLPIEANGASWAAFYTPVAITDGTVKTNVPSAALVSNLFMEKYTMRHAYDVVAGPNYGRIIAAGLIGPDYNYSRSDLDLLEPFGVNCMVYVPRRGTLINSNKTAKQTPVSALSSVNVRELVIYLQDEIAYLLQSYQWELNTQTLRDTVKAKADTILENVQGNGGVYAFRNTCDETNNTDEVIDNEMLVLSTEIEPGRGCGKMVEELTIYRKGGLSSSAT